MVSSSEDGVAISRAMPSILDKHMPTTYWNTFCDELDEVLKPVVEAKKFLGWCSMINFVDIVLSIVLIVLSFITVSISSGLFWGLLAASWGVSALAQCYLLCKVKSITENILKRMEEVCSRAVQQYPEIVLKVRARDEVFNNNTGTSQRITCTAKTFFNNLDYIEVSINPAEP